MCIYVCIHTFKKTISLPPKQKNTQKHKPQNPGVAQRVAEERGESLGNSVGYMIRGENKTGPATRLAFCTTGIILRRLQQSQSQAGAGKAAGVSLCVDGCVCIYCMLW
jgi:hypothetical protein